MSCHPFIQHANEKHKTIYHSQKKKRKKEDDLIYRVFGEKKKKLSSK